MIFTDKLGSPYETVGFPDCRQWSLYEWDEDEVGHGMWLICEDGVYSLEYQIEGVGAFVVGCHSELEILEFINMIQ